MNKVGAIAAVVVVIMTLMSPSVFAQGAIPDIDDFGHARTGEMLRIALQGAAVLFAILGAMSILAEGMVMRSMMCMVLAGVLIGLPLFLDATSPPIQSITLDPGSVVVIDRRGTPRDWSTVWTVLWWIGSGVLSLGLTTGGAFLGAKYWEWRQLQRRCVDELHAQIMALDPLQFAEYLELEAREWMASGRLRRADLLHDALRRFPWQHRMIPLRTSAEATPQADPNKESIGLYSGRIVP